MVAVLDPQLDVDAARALLTLPVDEAEQSVADAAIALDHRRAMREPRPRSGPPPRCSACCRFVRSTKVPCRACGYMTGQGYPG